MKEESREENKVENVDFGIALSERYLAYALSTIMSRSLPSVRDGLKPVHRRLLYAMLGLHLDPKSAYKKCARVVGDVIGKYHPHGDTAVYDTLVRLAQSFSLRYPLIDGQGNFGSIDGDNAAAMRYTESRMTEICMFLIQNIDENTVDFRLTYDDSSSEPVLFPAMFPNLLANGSEGIAVGMATSIPPHNLHELCDALLHLLDYPDAKMQEIMSLVKGPDFPTGGIVIDSPATIAQNYSTGRGSFRVRARWEKEELSHGAYQIVVSEIPYQIQKSKLIENIATLLKDKKIPLVANIRDESAEEIRLIIEPKSRSCDPEMVMESLFKLSTLESRVQLNMNVISSNNIPKVMNIIEVLQEFLAHRRDIITRRSNYLVDKINKRLEILAGLKIAYLHLDEIIHIIREEDEPALVLKHKFALTDVQAESILNTRLRSLRKIEEIQINKEIAELERQHIELIKILQEPKQLRAVIKKEIKLIQSKFGFDTKIGARRTSFAEVTTNSQVVDITAFIEKEPITVICSKMGWIRSIRGHNHDSSQIKYKEGDETRFIIECYTTDKIIISSALGKFFTILADNLSKGKGYGESIKLLIDLANDEVVSIMTYKIGQKFLLASKAGKGFVVSSEEVLAQTKLGKQIMQLSENNQCVACLPLEGDSVACIGENRKLLIFKLSEIPELKRGQGVVLQKFKDAKLADIKLFNSAEGLSWISSGKVKIEKDISGWLAGRGGVGKIPPAGFAKTNRFY